MELEKILNKLRDAANPTVADGMTRFGINKKNVIGVSIPTLRAIAKQTGKNHTLALQLWDQDIHEAKIIAGMIDDPREVTEEQIESWVNDFDSWDVCDQTCNNLFRKTSHAYLKANEWCSREKEFVKRAGFALIATLAVGDKKAEDHLFEVFFNHIADHATDNRNFVKKAVNWALRQIGKRNLRLHKRALQVAESLAKHPSPSARWIANDALRELRSEKIIARIKR
ncbi:MAG: DNA alkylation repair protein [Candidatus Auribacterota bacterium]|jgi:3-methyladenine DNA glycosylase AlkD|nr:DNA alkylation repair protein [Candidatus Auribacterota bacterium]